MSTLTTDWDVSELWSKPLDWLNPALTAGSKNWTHLWRQVLKLLLAKGLLRRRQKNNLTVTSFSVVVTLQVWSNKWQILKLNLHHERKLVWSMIVGRWRNARQRYTSITECGALFILTNMCLRNYSVYKSNIRCSSQAKLFAFVNLVQMSLHVMSLLRGKKMTMMWWAQHLKGVHAQASCFMYVAFLVVYNNNYPIKEQQCIADALWC